ncbi:White-opaque regulator 1 [Cytospora mali]|uniref:White-opaque regulator 1 n=1 Tax=Cytospora mali TaxID=578113 RepID=A0A194W0B3_CYTMA|nr:White-opaque regulator 1 [Valsa mali]
MVYCGKLSKGCEQCRFRKVRCDQRKPGCKRCENSGTTCPGYRDLGQLLFRDESARTIEKARRDAHVDSFDVVRFERSQSQSTSVTCVTDPALFLDPSLARPLQLPLRQMAANFFFNNFVVEGPQTTDTNYQLLVDMYQNHPDSAAVHAMEAVGLAGLSNISRDHKLRFEAQKRYGRALTRTNDSLGDPVQATSDLTAMSVLLLGQFESMIVESWDQYSRLIAHVEGASALLKLRGQEQFQRESGICMFMALRLQVLTYCMQRELPVPNCLLEGARALQDSPIERPRSSKVSLGDAYIRYVNVIAAIKTTGPPGQVDMQWLLEEVDYIDSVLQGWRLELNPDYDYTTVDVTAVTADEICDLPLADGTKAKRHIYKTKWSVHIWNKWRIMYMMLYKLKLDYNISNNRQQCEKAIREASMGICLSVPSLLASSRALTLIWPLYIISQEVLKYVC